MQNMSAHPLHLKLEGSYFRDNASMWRAAIKPLQASTAEGGVFIALFLGNLSGEPSSQRCRRLRSPAELLSMIVSVGRAEMADPSQPPYAIVTPL